MHHIRGAWPLAPALAAIFLIARPGAVDPQISSLATSIVAVLLAVAVMRSYARSRIEPLVAIVERIAAGETDVTIPGRNDGLGRRLSAAVSSLAATMATSRSEAATDPLTGIHNRQSIIGALFTEVERSIRYRRPLAVAFVDIDHFKTINDTYGHEAGDEVLRAIGASVRDNVRASDVAGRYGGEEFMVVLPETTVDEAALLADKIRTIAARLRFVFAGAGDVAVTVSVGVTGGVGDRLSVDALIREADGAMYAAKALGRDQVYAFVEPDDDSPVMRSPISASGRADAIELGRRAHTAAADALAEMIAPLPHYRGQPSALIATIVVALARELDLPPHEIDRIRIAALLHDVGKIGVPQEILDKPASLTPTEWRSVVQHPRIGQVILEQATTLRDAVPIILHHHERFGGAGYPHGLKGTEIPLGARIVAIADAYDAMIQDRPYKRAISHEAAIRELRHHAGTQFDPELVDLFCDTYANRPPVADPAATGFASAFGRARVIDVPETGDWIRASDG